MESCTHCQSTKLIKYGKTSWNNQRYKGKSCGKVLNKPKEKRGKPQAVKDRVILLYTMFSASFRSICKLLNVSSVSVLKWVRAYANTLDRPQIPPPSSGVVLDEMWHFVNGKSNKVWLWKAYCLETKRTFAWKIGARDAATLRDFINEIGIEERDFVTDNYETYNELIPEIHHFVGKDITFPIEQDNSNTRHYIGRFRRKSKITSRNVTMVDLSLLLLCHLQHKNLFDTLKLFTFFIIAITATSCYRPVSTQYRINIAEIERKIQSGIKPDNIQNTSNFVKGTLLNEACYLGQIDVVKLLLRNDADPNAKDGYGNTPLANAVLKDHYDIAKCLLSLTDGIVYRNVNCLVHTKKYTQSVLAEALLHNNKRMVVLLRSCGADINHQYEDGLSDIQRIHSSKQANILLKAGATYVNNALFNLPNTDQCDRKELDKIVKVLLKYEGHLDQLTDDYDLPLNYEASRGNVEKAEVLIQNGAPLGLGTACMQTGTPIFLAAAYGHLEMVKLLLKYGADIDDQNYWCITPLSAAASCGEIFQENRWQSDKDIPRGDRNSYFEIVKLLIKKGAKINTKEKYGETPLTHAVKADHIGIVKILIENNAEISWKKESVFDIDPPILLAKSLGLYDIAHILESKLRSENSPKEP
jgi:IS1 family transposase/ankyrin repeat protein/transposase-like protein